MMDVPALPLCVTCEETRTGRGGSHDPTWLGKATSCEKIGQALPKYRLMTRSECLCGWEEKMRHLLNRQ